MLKSTLRYQIDTLLLMARTTTDESLRNELCNEAYDLLSGFSDENAHIFDDEYEIYNASNIKKGIQMICNKYQKKKFRATEIITFFEENNIYLVEESARSIGRCLIKWSKYFIKDGIYIKVINKGNASKIYEFTKINIQEEV